MPYIIGMLKTRTHTTKGAEMSIKLIADVGAAKNAAGMTIVVGDVVFVQNIPNGRVGSHRSGPVVFKPLHQIPADCLSDAEQMRKAQVIGLHSEHSDGVTVTECAVRLIHPKLIDLIGGEVIRVSPDDLSTESVFGGLA